MGVAAGELGDDGLLLEQAVMNVETVVNNIKNNPMVKVLTEHSFI